MRDAEKQIWEALREGHVVGTALAVIQAGARVPPVAALAALNV